MINKYKRSDDISKKSNKIPLDKYYTSPELAKYVVEKTKEIIGEDNIAEYLEPSAGGGVFLDYLDKPYLAYDIEPEDDRIAKQDYLELELDYKKGRCVIGNPPYGSRNNIYRSFFIKSVEFADYVAFILPLSQLNNNYQLYHFDLVYSENLGSWDYSGRTIECCFSVFKRPKDGKINNKPNYRLNDITIKENRRGHTDIGNFKYDVGICVYGAGIIGKIPQYIGQYTKEMYFKVNNEAYKDQVIDLIKNTDWENDVCNKSSSGQLGLPQWRIYKYLKEQIPELE